MVVHAHVVGLADDLVDVDVDVFERGQGRESPLHGGLEVELDRLAVAGEDDAVAAGRGPDVQVQVGHHRLHLLHRVADRRLELGDVEGEDLLARGLVEDAQALAILEATDEGLAVLVDDGDDALAVAGRRGQRGGDDEQQGGQERGGSWHPGHGSTSWCGSGSVA
ncbi:MAG: hypothetical protein IPI34_07925 [bacterium]|nr:hypothetical protein [bacterium]